MTEETLNPVISGSSDKKKEVDNDLVFSYLTLRNLIGFTGMALPVALAVLPKRPSDYHGFEPSISDYFYTDRGDILVVFLCIIGVFLFTYKGYTRGERLLTVVAAIAGMGIAFVPTKMSCDECLLSVHTGSGGVLGQIAGTGWHFIFAATFLLSLAVMSLVYFPRTLDKSKLIKENGNMTPKGKRNVVYKISGWTMIISVAVLGIYFLAEPNLGAFPIVYVLETIAVEAFGISWLTKGETLWPDGQHYLVTGIKLLQKGR